MDQAVCLLNKKGHASKIDFYPLRVKHIKLPESFCLVVCNSLIKAEKSGSMLQAYNLRARECKIGIEMINAFLRKIVMPEIKLLGDVPGMMEGLGFDNCNRFLYTVFAKEKYTINEIAKYCSKDISEIKNLTEGFKTDSFAVKKRCRHVLKEGARVNRGSEYLENEKIEDFCRLMNESHTSCANDYEISCKEVDELVKICSESGAEGARITGAGFGGCVVCMLNKEKAESFVEKVKTRYYSEYLKRVHPEIDITGENIIICSSVDGAGRLS